MYLIETNVISEARKKAKANPGVLAFFQRVAAADQLVYLSTTSVGELRRGVELIRHRGEGDQARLLEVWLEIVLTEFAENILPLDTDAARVWRRLRVPDPHRELNKQIAAIALVNDLTLVTRNVADFEQTGVRLLTPFSVP